jgi:hypothetical protein
MEAGDELIHAYPDNLDSPWKENWYFNFIDRGTMPGASITFH